MVEEDNSKMKELVGFTEEELIEAYGTYGQALKMKAEIYDKIGELTQKLIDNKTSEKSELDNLWNATIWEDVLNGKFTLDNKKAYIAEHIRPTKEEGESIQMKIDSCWRDVDIINTFLKIGGLDD